MNATVKISTALALVCAALFIGGANGQQPTPPMIIVQPAGAVGTAAPKPAASTSEATLSTAIKALEQVKAANDETLKKQDAMLQQLDELQKAAEQLKIFSKRV